MIPLVAERMNFPSRDSVISSITVFRKADGVAIRIISHCLTTSFMSLVAFIMLVSNSTSLRYFAFLPSVVRLSRTSSFRTCHHTSILFLSSVWTRAVAQLPYPITPQRDVSVILCGMVLTLVAYKYIYISSNSKTTGIIFRSFFPSSMLQADPVTSGVRQGSF